MYKKQLKTIIIGLSLIFLMTGCNFLPQILKKTDNQITNPPPEVKLPVENNSATTSPTTIIGKLKAQDNIKKFTNVDELTEFMSAGGLSANYGYGVTDMISKKSDSMLWSGTESSFQSPSGLGSMAMPSSAKSFDSAANQSVAATTDFSKTNIQVAGVDEADIIKTDGNYIYAVAKNNLFIISAKPAEKAEIVVKIEFKSRPEDIYINGNNLIVYGTDDKFYATDVYKKFRRQNQYVFFKVFDITDKKNPRQVRDLQFEGAISDSRMIGDYVYFVVANYQYYLFDNEPVLPRVLDGGEVLGNKCASGVKCFSPDLYYFDIPYNSYNFTTVAAINVKDNSAAISGDLYLMNTNQNMYVSPSAMYITYTKYISEYELEMEAMKEIVWPLLNERDKERIAKIESADNFILSAEEKKNKIQQIIERFGASLTPEEQTKLENDLQEKMKQKYQDISKELEKTVIHKIALGDGNLEYKTNGEVTGQVLNQFSMDENNGYFRIATTKNQAWSRYEATSTQSYNNLYVLDENLKTVGSLENVAPGERIYSARFMQNRAYLVTFKKTDPLFTIELTDPRNPKILGALKIPGFSSYLHPYDDTTLIGLGKDTEENKWGGVVTKGIKLSLFDVADVTAPKEINTYVLGGAGSDSIALNDHKAFLFSRDKNLLVIPATINAGGVNGGWGKLAFSGAAVFTVDKTGFKLRGKIDHSDGGQSATSDYWRGYSYYDNNVLRGLYIDDALYTFSNNYLKINSLDDLKEIKNLPLEKDNAKDFDILN